MSELMTETAIVTDRKKTDEQTASGVCSLSKLSFGSGSKTAPDAAESKTIRLAVLEQPKRVASSTDTKSTVDYEQLLQTLTSGTEAERLKALETLSQLVNAEADPERSKKIISAIILL